MEFIDLEALDAHMASIARKVYLEENTKKAGVSKKELKEMIRMFL